MGTRLRSPLIGAGRRPFLMQIPAGDATELQSRLTVRRFRTGERVVHRELGEDAVAVILAGHVKLTARAADGREVLLGVRGPGELGGELAALGSRPAATITTAVEPAEVGFMSATDLRAFLIERPRVALAALRELAARLDHSQRRRVEQSSGNRLALAGAGLLELAERYGQQTELGVRVELPLAPDALAGLFDADPETVARALRLMRRLGWVSMSRSDIVVHDLEAMRRRRSAEWREPAPQVAAPARRLTGNRATQRRHISLVTGVLPL